MKLDSIKVDIEPCVDWQEYYNDLLIKKELIEAQIERLGKEPSVCTHPVSEWTKHDEITVCSCGRIMDKGKWSWVSNK